MKSIYTLFILFVSSFLQAQPGMSTVTPFEQNPNYSASYLETMDYFTRLARQYDALRLLEYGMTDAGYPLHLAVLSVDKEFNPDSLRAAGKTILLINNAIHPGEPCGVDASMMFVRDLLENPDRERLLKDLVVVVIPFYNIGGGLNRGAYSRANQVGPELHGFRGNARNYDLNRDFIKCDTRNAQTFNQLYNEWQPHVFIDNHTSNGADYQYTLTLIATQHNKLTEPLSSLLTGDMLPWLYQEMEQTEYEMTPYVYVRNTPDEGIAGFMDLPRYSTGYTALHHTIGFMPETHMLKPYRDRVYSVYQFMNTMVEYLAEKGGAVQNARLLAQQQTANDPTIDLNWRLDMEAIDTLRFKGYEFEYKPSEVTGMDRLYYDRNKPYEKFVPFLNEYVPTLTMEKPEAYIIPQGYVEVIERLRWNGVEMIPLEEDQEMEVEHYYILDFDSPDYPYEGHYLHRDMEVDKVTRKWTYRKGDLLIPMGRATDLFVMSVLEPEAPDSYFAWNFFDAILGQKEYFSSYVFEDRAAELLEADPELRAAFEEAKANDEELANNARAQLNWIYRRSPHYEETHRLYPVGRVME